MDKRPGIFASLRHRDYLLFWTGSLISNIGTWLQSAALLWYIKETTGSNAWVSAVNMANFIPVLLFILPAGYMADTRDRKSIVLTGFAVMGLASLALGITSSADVARLPVIMALVFITGTAYAFCLPAGNTLLPDLVSKDEMLNALALSSAQYNVGRVVGPALGGLVVSALSVAAAFYLNAVSFLIVVIAVLLVRTSFPPRETASPGMYKHIKEGFAYVRERGWMVAVLLTLGLATFFGYACTVLYPAIARDMLGKGASAYGIILSLTGVGAVAGAPLVTVLNRRFAEKAIIATVPLGLGLCTVAMSFSHAFWLTGLAAMGLGCFYLMLGACVNTVLQARSQPGMKGRVVSFYSMLGLGMFPLGGMLMGWLADAVDTPFPLRVGGSACAAITLVLLLVPRLISGADSSLGPD
jgi:MFS family permease